MSEEGIVRLGRSVMPESFGDVERAFKEDLIEFGDSHFRYSQTFELCERMLPQLRRHAEAEKLEPTAYEDILVEFRRTVSDIAWAMRNLSTKLEDGVIWCDPSLVDLGQHREEWRDVSPVDADALNMVVIRYFERPWMQSNTLEWFILRGYLFDSMARLRRDAMNGSLFGVTNWAYIFSKANAESAVFWRAGLELTKFALRWLLLPAVAGALFFAGREEEAIWAAAVTAAWFGWSLLTLPFRWMTGRELSRQMDLWRDRLKRLSYLYVRVSSPIWAPADILYLAQQAQDEGVYFCPAVMSLLRRAEARDPSLFIALPGEPTGARRARERSFGWPV